MNQNRAKRKCIYLNHQQIQRIINFVKGKNWKFSSFEIFITIFLITIFQIQLDVDKFDKFYNKDLFSDRPFLRQIRVDADPRPIKRP